MWTFSLKEISAKPLLPTQPTVWATLHGYIAWSRLL